MGESIEIQIISQEKIKNLNIPMIDVIEAVEADLKSKGQGKNEMPAQIGIHPRENSFIHAMLCELAEIQTIWDLNGFPVTRQIHQKNCLT